MTNSVIESILMTAPLYIIGILLYIINAVLIGIKRGFFTIMEMISNSVGILFVISVIIISLWILWRING